MCPALAVSCICFLSSAIVVGVHERAGPSGLYLAQKCIHLHHDGVQVAFENKAIGAKEQVTFLMSKCDQTRTGCALHERAS